MFKRGKFDQVNSMLMNLEVQNLTDMQIVIYLGGTHPAKDKLPYRKEFYHKAKEVLISRGRDVKGLLHGWE